MEYREETGSTGGCKACKDVLHGAKGEYEEQMLALNIKM